MIIGLPFLLMLFATIQLCNNAEIKVLKSEVRGQLKDLKWCGQDIIDDYNSQDLDSPNYHNKVMFMATDTAIMRSIDNGHVWNNMHQKFNDAISKAKHSGEYGRIIKIVKSKAENQFIYFLGDNEYSFYSKNCGDSVHIIKHEKSMIDLKPNPNDEHQFILFQKFDCSQNSELCNYGYTLYYGDYGKNQKFIKKYSNIIVQAEFAEQYADYSEEVPNSRIIFTHLKKKKSGKYVQEVKYTDDNFKSSKFINKDMNIYRFYIGGDHLYLLTLGDKAEQNIGNENERKMRKLRIKIAKNKDSFYSVKDIEIDTNTVQDHSFTVISQGNSEFTNPDQSILFNVNHYDQQSQFGEVYGSCSYDGKKYELFMRNNVRNDNGFCDFRKIEGIPGTYIANKYEDKIVQQYKNEQNQVQKDNLKAQLDNYKYSQITFNAAKDWFDLRLKCDKHENIRVSTSEVREDGTCENGDCDGSNQCYDCRLNLKGITDMRNSRIFASDQALGVIIGVGSTGRYLSNNQDDIKTYISVNNGQNWEKLFDREMLYSVGNHGGLLVLGDKLQKVNDIHFSWNMGQSFESLKITQDPISLVQISVEPTEMGQVFIVIGHDDETTYFFTVDFEQLHQKTCYGIWKPNADDSDFVLYEPHTLLDDKCYMGSRVRIIQKKRESACFVQQDQQYFDEHFRQKSCNCTRNDYECDIGFKYIRSNDSCVAVDDHFYSLTQPPHSKNCKNKYSIKTGYKKIPNNECINPLHKYSSTKHYDCSHLQKDLKERKEQENKEKQFEHEQEEMQKAIVEERSKTLEQKLKELEEKQMSQQDYINSISSKQAQQEFIITHPKKEHTPFFRSYLMVGLLVIVGIGLLVFIFYETIIDKYLDMKQSRLQSQNKYQNINDQDFENTAFEQ